MDKLLLFIEHQLNTEFKDLNEYPETYTVEYDPEKQIIFLYPSTSTSKDESLWHKLLNITSYNIFHDYIDHILKQYIENLISTELILYEDGTIGIVLRVSPKDEKSTIPGETPLETYVEIVKNLDYQSLETLCMTDKSFVSLCDNQKFWKELIRVKYPELLYPTNIKYDYRKIYAAESYIEQMKTKLFRLISKPPVNTDKKIITYIHELSKYLYRKTGKLFKHLNQYVLVAFIAQYTKDYDFLKEILQPLSLRILTVNKLFGNNNERIKDKLMKQIILDKLLDIIMSDPEKIRRLESLIPELSKQQIIRILSDEKVTEGLKIYFIDEIIAFDQNLKFDRLIEYINVFTRTINQDIIIQLLSRAMTSKNYDIIRGLLGAYPDYITAEDISRKLETIEYDRKLYCYIFNLDIMKKKYLSDV